MSHYYEVRVTLCVDGDERDVSVRGFVSVEPDVGATLNGDMDVHIGHDWWSIRSVALGHGDLSRAEDALLETALNDDSAWSVAR